MTSPSNRIPNTPDDTINSSDTILLGTNITPTAPPSSEFQIPHIWKHVFEEFLGYPPDTPIGYSLQLWVKYQQIRDMEDFILWKKEDFEPNKASMGYNSTSIENGAIDKYLSVNTTKQLFNVWKFTVKSFRDGDLDEEGISTTIADEYFIEYTKRDFKMFVLFDEPDAHDSPPTPSPPRIANKTTPATETSITSQQLLTFKKGIKRDINEYPIIKDDTYFNGFHRTVSITTRSHDCEDIINPSFRPLNKPDCMELFNHKQIFMYKVFNRSLQSDMGKTIVRKHAKTLDAQKVWSEYLNHMTNSSKGKAERRKLHQYVSTTTLDNSYKGSTEQFVLHFHEQFRLLDEVSSESEIIPPTLRLILLQNAVSKVEQLSIVETLEEYNSLHPGQITKDNLTYDIYLGLLTNACIRLDNKRKQKSDQSRMTYQSYIESQHPYQHHDQEIDIFQSHQRNQMMQVNIDTPADQFYSVNSTNFNRSPPTHHLVPRKPMGNNNKPKKLYDGPVFLPAHIYKMLPDNIVKSLKDYNEQAIKKYKSRQVKQHRQNSELVDSTTSGNFGTGEESEDTRYSNSVDNDIIGTTEGDPEVPPEFHHSYGIEHDLVSQFLDQIPDSYNINMCRIYHISKHKSSSLGSLIDRGANGGLAGGDVRVLSYTGRTVSVTGIDNHALPGLEIVTCATLLNTNKGKIILIMNEYAHYGRGNTIHSPGQIEWFKNTCDDKSVKVGGKQILHLLDGYVAPLDCKGGLIYLPILGPPTDEDMEKYPHVLLTSPHEWDPSVLDHSHLDIMEHPIPNLDDSNHHIHDARIDQFGDYQHRSIQLHTFQHQQNKHEVDFEKLRPFFGWVQPDVIKKTFDKSTQWAVAITRFPMRKHIKSRFPALNISRRSEPVATDTIFSDTPAIDSGVKIAQLFIGKHTLVADIYPMRSEKQFVNTLEDNIRKRGAMDKLISDYAKVEISYKVQDILRMYHIKDWQSEPYHQNQNPAEGRYRTIKAWTNTIMNRTGAPANYWLLCMTYVCYLLNHMSCQSLNGEIPLTKLYGVTPDISILLIYTFNQSVFYASHNQDFPSASEEKLAVWVGFGEHVGDALTHKLLDLNTSKIVYRSAVRPNSQRHPNKRLCPEVGENSRPTKPIHFVKSRQDRDSTSGHIPMAQYDPSSLIGRTFLLPKNETGEILRAQIKQQIIEITSTLDETDDSRADNINFLLDVGHGRSEMILSYNQILDYLEQDNQDETHFKFRNILGHEGPLDKDNPEYKGSLYNVQVEWENGEITFEPLSIIAADDPVTCAMYALDNKLLNLPGWKRFKHIAKNQKVLARAINQSKIRQVRRSDNYQFGYLVPRDYTHAMEIDKLNGNSKWYDATQLEMNQINDYQVFKDYGKAQLCPKNRKAINGPKNYQQIRVRLIFAVKHDGRHKARLVAGGHLTPEPVESIYSGVVSLRSLRITIFLSVLNKLDLWGADIGNAYLEATTDEKVYIVAGPEFEELQGHILVIQKALYGLKSSGLRWSQKLHDIMIDIGFKPSKADPCVWLKPNVEENHYEYIAIYVDDLLIAMKNPKSFIDTLKSKYKLKIKGDGPLTYHLGCDYIKDPDGTLLATPRKYISKILDSFSKMYPDEKFISIKSPLEKNDHPELDNSELVDHQEIQKYMSMIGQLQWAISLGRFDIQVHAMSMSRFRLAPRKGHIERVKRMYSYLNKTKQYGIRFRTDIPDLSHLQEISPDWARSVYGDVKEEIPTDAPKQLGKVVYSFTFFDANLYHDKVTGRSVTAILHYLNSTPADWYSKKQATVENATYGSEFVAAKTASEQILDLRTTLRYLGVPIHNKSYMFGDNQSVITSSTVPHSLLSKRHNALAYHKVRECIAAGIISLHWSNSELNWSDILSKHWEYSKVFHLLRKVFDYQGKLSILEDPSQDGE